MEDIILKELKSRLDITWDEEITNQKLKNILKNAIPKTNRLIGFEIEDYTKTGYGEELELLLNYCMYMWENKSELFKTNYSDDIISLRGKYEVLDLKKEESSTNGTEQNV